MPCFFGESHSICFQHGSQNLVQGKPASKASEPLLERAQKGALDAAAVIKHHLTLDEAAHGYDIFLKKQE